MDGTALRGFSEQDFYLQEFRGRTLALVAPRAEDLEHPTVVKTLAALRDGGARALVVASDPRVLAACTGSDPQPATAERLEGDLWRRLGRSPVCGVLVSSVSFAAELRALAVRLGLFKVVWLDAGGGLRSEREGRHSFVHLEELAGWLGRDGDGLATRERLALWREIAALLEAGVPAVNVCAAAGLGEELFTYQGSGTLFTRERYMTVRDLSIDDYDAAHDLVTRGVQEGYLAPRSQSEVDRVLASAFGAFVEGRDLAGIGSLLRWDDVGEISSLYTLTRFLGEGVGQHLVAYAVERAAAQGLRAVFACTTTDTVATFFERQGFARVSSDALPRAKWETYDEGRRAKVVCFLREL